MAHRAHSRSFTLSCTSLLILVAGSGCLRPNYLSDADPIYPDLSIAVVVENPAGSGEKWEVRSNGRLIQEQGANGPITIPYLPWPVNGGMVPRTLYSAELGGDGEPLDVLVLGPAIPRGEQVRARAIGLLRVVDRLERDDKILAIRMEGAFSDVPDIETLERLYPGVRDSLADWFSNSRPGAAIEVQGYGSRAAAHRLIADGVMAFEQAVDEGTLPEWTTP